MWLGINHVIRANHTISFTTSSTMDPWFPFSHLNPTNPGLHLAMYGRDLNPTNPGS
jgi:hypothetical protein